MSNQAAAVAEEVPPVSEKLDTPPRGTGTTQMLVEIDCRSHGVMIPGGNLARLGTYRYRMYTGYLPILMSQVMTDDDRAEYKRARDLFDKAVAKFVDEHTGGLKKGTVEYQAQEEECLATFADSPESFFTRDTGRSVPPFNRVTVIEENLPAPADEAAIARAKETAALAAQVVAEMQRAAQQQQAQQSQQKK
jgi:hypothetical protein